MNAQLQQALDHLMVGMIKYSARVFTMEDMIDFSAWAEENPSLLNDYDVSPSKAMFVYCDYLIHGPKQTAKKIYEQVSLPFANTVSVQA